MKTKRKTCLTVGKKVCGLAHGTFYLLKSEQILLTFSLVY